MDLELVGLLTVKMLEVLTQVVPLELVSLPWSCWRCWVSALLVDLELAGLLTVEVLGAAVLTQGVPLELVSSP